ncbi:MAG: hypothetical protein UGF89_07705 [Acutalibacteraceae bacterium]|nr:hypothetical protein [Acutalibacteraceae bacterium]
MKKSVLIAIQPYWVFLIIAKTMGWDVKEEKTVEVRKNFPKDENWDKTVKIYCSKDAKSFNRIPKEYQPAMKQFLGKVIGEFMCYEITEYPYETFNDGEHLMPYGELEKTCLDGWKLYEYLGTKNGFGWHIVDLVIYDKPKELKELCLYDVRAYYDEELKLPMPTHEIKRPPQSWCYVKGWFYAEK